MSTTEAQRRAAGSAAGTSEEDLAVVLGAWHNLPSGVREAILAIIRAVNSKDVGG